MGCGLGILLLLQLAEFGNGVFAANAPTTALGVNRPGNRNPLGDDQREREPIRADDELFFLGTHGGNLALGVASSPEEARVAREWADSAPLAAGSGKILGAPFHQGAVIRTEPGSAPVLEIISLGDPADIVFSRTPLALLFPLASQKLSLAVGDFDGQDEAELRDPNAINREYRDEVVVACAVTPPGGGNPQVVVAVYNYYSTGFPADLANPPSAPLVTNIVLSTPLYAGAPDARIIIKAGDLERNGDHEIIVGYLNPSRFFQATVLKYERAGPDLTEARLTEKSSTVLGGVTESVAAAEGYDLDVSRFDEDTATVVFAKRNGNQIFVGGWQIDASCAQGDLNCELMAYLDSHEGTFGIAPGIGDLELLNDSRVRISSTRNQSKHLYVLADCQRGPVVMRFQIENSEDGSDTTFPDPWSPVWPAAAELAARPVTTATSSLQMVAGNFLARRSSSDSFLDSLYLHNSDGTPRLSLVEVSPNGIGTTTNSAAFLNPTDPVSLADVLLVPADADGDHAYYRFSQSESGLFLYLGEPLHFILHGLQTFDVVLQEPPKHIDYLPSEDTGADVNSGVVNVSKTDGFLTRLTQSTGEGDSIEKVKRTDWVIAEFTSDNTSLNFGLELFGASKAGLTDESKRTLDHVHQESVELGDSREESFTYTEINTASKDDQLVWRRRNVDIWRYPILGQTTLEGQSESAARFLEIVIPESMPAGENSSQISPINRTSGTTFEDYQPRHINGNLLSYPRLDKANAQAVQPPDLGGFIEHERAADTVLSHRTGYTNGNPNYRAEVHPLVESPIWPTGPLVAVNADSGTTISLEFSSTVKERSSVSSSGTLRTTDESSVGVDLGGAFLETFSLGAAQSLGSTTVAEESWSQARIVESTLSSSTIVEVGTTQGMLANPDTQNYRFCPIFYTSTDGALKCAYWTDLEVEGNVGTFWTTHYSGPDAALNLPRTFLPDGRLNTDSGRQRMKGFFLREGKLKTGILYQDLDATAETPGDLLAQIPSAGEKVQLQVRVYNLSVPEAGTPITNLTVRFEVVALAGQPPTESSMRTWIGDAAVPIIQPGEVTNAFFLWDIPADLGSQNPGGLADYRVYVTLDPNDEIPNETHEWRDRYCRPLVDGSGNPIDDGIEKGQNNAGYFDLTIAAAVLPSPAPAARSFPATIPADASGTAAPLTRQHDVWLNEDSLTVLGVGPSPVEADPTQEISVGDQVWFAVSIASDRRILRNSTLTLYEGDPADGNAVHYGTVRGIDAVQGAHLYCDWRPKAPGTYVFTASYFESLYDIHPGNASDTVVVTVSEAAARGFVSSSLPAPRAASVSGPGPVAVDDVLTVSFDDHISLATSILLTNDIGSNLSNRCIQVVGGTSPTRGEITEFPNQTITYDPAGRFNFLQPGQSWVDQFFYTIVDEHGRVARARVRVNVYRPGAFIDALRTGNEVQINWTEQGATLQWASELEGPWHDVVNASSPYPVTRDSQAKYFRLKL